MENGRRNGRTISPARLQDPRPPDFLTVFKECSIITRALGVRRINKSVCYKMSYCQQPRATLTVSVERVRGIVGAGV